MVLIGLPGAGKSSVAPHAARLLQSSWCDLDQLVADAAGESIAEIFSRHGESHFRNLERAAMEQALNQPAQVIAAGGGWASEPGNLDTAAGRALVIYLSIEPSVAARRVRGNFGRPLVGGESPERQISLLLAARERWYRLADLEIAAGDASPETIAAGVVTAARQYGGW